MRLCVRVATGDTSIDAATTGDAVAASLISAPGVSGGLFLAPAMSLLVLVVLVLPLYL